MIRIAALMLLLTAPAFAGDRVYVDSRCDGPGRYDAMREGADCFNPPACGIVVWEANPHCHDARERIACAPGYEQACDARDHGAHPYQPYGGRR